MKISKRTRADAIAICEQRSDPANACHTASDLAEHIGAVDHSPGSNSPAYCLAFDAWRVVLELTAGTHWSVYWLEAAALLRDGWCPGDPVERLS